MTGTPDSSMIRDAETDTHLRGRLISMRPAHVTDQDIHMRMNALVREPVTDAGDTIASVLRYGLANHGKDAGLYGTAVTDGHLVTSLAKVFPAPESA